MVASEMWLGSRMFNEPQPYSGSIGLAWKKKLQDYFDEEIKFYNT
jgi:hypothetical protein